MDFTSFDQISFQVEPINGIMLGKYDECAATPYLSMVPFTLFTPSIWLSREPLLGSIPVEQGIADGAFAAATAANGEDHVERSTHLPTTDRGRNS